jgi:hypothetical protein
VAGRGADGVRHVLGAAREADGDGGTALDPRVAAVERELERLRARLPASQPGFEVGDERGSGGDPPMLVTDAARFARWRS